MSTGKKNGWQFCSAALKRRKTILAIKILAVFSIFFVVTRGHIDPDFGWHLMSGNYYRSHWIPSHDIYSYTAHSFPWINHEWGNDVLVSFIFQLGGYSLVSAVFSALWTGALFLSNKRARLGVFLLAATAIVPYVGVRPTVWTVLFLVLLLRISTTKQKKTLYLIPLLMLVWVNLHAGFTVGLAIILYFAVTRWRQKTWWYVLVLSALVTLINPYGWHIYIEVIRTFSDKALPLQITEWRQAFFPVRTWPFMLLWAIGFWFYSRRNISNWYKPQSFLLLASFLATRNVPLFVAVAQNDLEDFFDTLKHNFKIELKNKSMLATKLFAFTSVICSLYMLFIWQYPGIAGNRNPASYTFPAITYLTRHPCPGNLFNDYDYGGYITWKLPGQEIYIDGRMPTWRDENGVLYYDRYLAIQKNQAAQSKEFNKYNIHCVLVSNTGQWDKLIHNLEGEGWQLVYNTQQVLLINNHEN